jgi:hypothetical protein
VKGKQIRRGGVHTGGIHTGADKGGAKDGEGEPADCTRNYRRYGQIQPEPPAGESPELRFFVSKRQGYCGARGDDSVPHRGTFSQIRRQIPQFSVTQGPGQEGQGRGLGERKGPRKTCREKTAAQRPQQFQAISVGHEDRETENGAGDRRFYDAVFY